MTWTLAILCFLAWLVCFGALAIGAWPVHVLLAATVGLALFNLVRGMPKP